MKILNANITFMQDGKETSLEFPSMLMKDLAHRLIEICQSDLQVTVTDAQKRVFEQEAKRDYMKTKTFTDYEAYQDLYVRLKIDNYIRLEHAKQAFNELILAQKQ